MKQHERQNSGAIQKGEDVTVRARAIKPGFFKNEGLAACSQATRLLFVGLWLLADREGRLEDRPKHIEAELFPYEEINVEGLLDELSVDHDGNGAFIRRYIVGGHRYIAISWPAEGRRSSPGSVTASRRPTS